MKRYLLFTWDTYYPGGGMNDLKGDFDTMKEINNKLKEIESYDELQIWDIQKNKEVDFGNLIENAMEDFDKKENDP